MTGRVCECHDKCLARIEKCELDLDTWDKRLISVEIISREIGRRIDDIKEQMKTFTVGMILTTSLGFIGIICAIVMK